MSAQSADKAITSSLGALQSAPSIFANTNLSTTATKVTLPSDPLTHRVYRIKIVNGSASATMAYTMVAKNAAAPTITADFAASTCGVIIPAASVDYINLATHLDLYIVASAASTSYCVAIFTE